MQAFQLTKEALWYKEVCFSPDGRWLALSGKALALLDTSGREPPAELPLGEFRWGFAFVRGGAAVACLRRTDCLCEYDLATRAVRQHTLAYAYALAADRAGATLYLSMRERPYRSTAWIQSMRAADLTVLATFGRVADDLRAVGLSADGRWLTCRAGNAFRAWNVGGPAPPKRASLLARCRGGAAGFALSADGAALAIASSRGLEVWNTRTRRKAFDSGKRRRGVVAVACSPTKPLIATGDSAGNVFFWDHAGNVLARYDWGLGGVEAVCFAPDGLRCAAADGTGKVVIWDVDA